MNDGAIAVIVMKIPKPFRYQQRAPHRFPNHSGDRQLAIPWDHRVIRTCPRERSRPFRVMRPGVAESAASDGAVD